MKVAFLANVRDGIFRASIHRLGQIGIYPPVCLILPQVLGFFVSTFNLDIPSYNDVFMSFNFDQSSQPYRAYLFVNGWMMGKRVANLGPQFNFPVHQGILDYNGTNTVAVALWVMEPNVTVLPTLELIVDGVLEGGVGGITTDNPRWSSREMF